MTAEKLDQLYGLIVKTHGHTQAGLTAVTNVRTAQRAGDKALDELITNKVAAANAVGAMLYLVQEEKGIAQPVSDAAKSTSNPYSKTLGIIIVAAALCLGAGYIHPEERKMTDAKPPGEIELTTRVEKEGSAGDFHAVLNTCGELHRAGAKAPAAYWEGVAYNGLGKPEAAAEAFVRAARHGHPLAEMALAKVRR